MPSPDDHRLAEERSLAYHEVVATRLREDPRLCERAKARVAGWLCDGSVAEPYAFAWRELLDGPREVLLDALVDPSEAMRALRQTSPFAGALEPRERWAIWRSVRSAGEAR
jgi:hypothetical protein